MDAATSGVGGVSTCDLQGVAPPPPALLSVFQRRRRLSGRRRRRRKSLRPDYNLYLFTVLAPLFCVVLLCTFPFQALAAPRLECFASSAASPPPPPPPLPQTPVLQLTNTITVGTQTVPWGASVCLTPEEVPFAEGEVEESLKVLGRGFSVAYSVWLQFWCGVAAHGRKNSGQWRMGEDF